MARILVVFSFWSCLTATPSSWGGENEQVQVAVRSGRVFEAQVDAQTNSVELALRTERGTMNILRRIAWDRVVSVVKDDQVFDASQFLEYLAAHPVEVVQVEEIDFAGVESPVEEGGLFVQAGSSDVSRPQSTVQSIRLHAELGFWDADVESDGLIVTVTPLDAFGNFTPVSGTIEIDLIGMHRGRKTLQNNFPQLERWTRAARPEAAGPDGYVFQLPFVSTHPEFALDVAPYGLVHVRFSAPGHGVFEASDSMTRIRSYSSFRDRAQQVLDRRFLPVEQNGIGRPPIRYGHL